MGLKPVRDTIAEAIPVFAKVFELFTGGFSLVSTNLRSGVILPAGSLVVVNETTKQMSPIKTAKLVIKGGTTATGYVVDSARYLKVGDVVGFAGGTGSYIRAISATGSYDKLTVGTTFGGTSVPADTVIYKTTARGSTILSGTANAITVYDMKVGDDNLSADAAVLRRGTAYKNRIQPHLAGHISGLPATIQISQSL